LTENEDVERVKAKID